MTQVVTTTTLRTNLAGVLEEVSSQREYLLVTRKGNPISALVNLDFFENLLAVTSPRYLKSIRGAREDYRKGRVLRHEEVFGEL